MYYLTALGAKSSKYVLRDVFLLESSAGNPLSFSFRFQRLYTLLGSQSFISPNLCICGHITFSTSAPVATFCHVILTLLPSSYNDLVTTLSPPMQSKIISLNISNTIISIHFLSQCKLTNSQTGRD